MKTFLVTLICILASFLTFSQSPDDVTIANRVHCLEHYQKVYPEPMRSPLAHGFAESISVYGNIAAVGIKLSDSLELDAGLVYVYEFDGLKWSKKAILYPSTPIPNMNFGTDVQVTENYIFVSSRYSWKSEKGGSYTLKDQIPGAIYVYKRSEFGWTSTTEITSLHLGANSNRVNMDKLRINHREDIIVLHSDTYFHFFIREGDVWGESDRLVSLEHANSTEWIRNVSVYDSLLAITVYDKETGVDKIHLKKAQDDWTMLTECMVINRPTRNYYNYGRETILSRDHLLVGNWAYTDSVFLYSTGDDWTTIKNRIVFISQNELINSWDYMNPDELFMNDTLIAIGRTSRSGSNVVSLYKKPVEGWSNSTENAVYEFPEISSNYRDASITFSSVHMIYSAQLAGSPESQGNNLLFYNIEGDEPKLIEDKTYYEINGTEMNFGQNAAICDNVLAVMTYDNARENMHKEEVHIHVKNPDDSWKKVNTISSNADQSIDFGSSMAFFEDYLVIGAPGYIEEGSAFPTGRAYVYKKSGDWSNVRLIAEMQPSDWLDAVHADYELDLSFGYTVAIDKNTIVVGAPGKNLNVEEPSDHGTLYVFEKLPGLEWASGYETARLISDHSSEYARIGSSLVLLDDCIITPHYWATKYSKALISVFKRPDSGWKDTVETYVHQIEGSGSRTFNQGQIVVNEDFLFVGDPIYRDFREGYLGRIFIFRKAGEHWSELDKINTLNYRQGSFPNYPVSPFPARRIGLGLTFSVVNNILIAGLDYQNGRSSPFDNLKGKVMVYQSLDSDWKNVNELTELESDNYFTQDKFGLRVMSNRDDIIICAPSDDSKAGINTGAVYNFSMSPTLKFQEPVCVDNGPVSLIAYPEGGVWSGMGIVDGTENLFYPDIASVGIHELTYSTQDCSYDGKIELIVKAKGKPIFKHPLEMEICGNGEVTLEVDSTGETSYRWYFLPGASTEKRVLSENAVLIRTNEPGKYWVESYNVLCPDVSDTVVVKITPNPISIVQPDTICDPYQKIEIEFVPAGGIWLSTAIDDDNMIVPTKLKPGQNTLLYELKATASCTFLDTIILAYDPLPDKQIVDNSHAICSGDSASVEINILADSQYFLHGLSGGELEITSSPFYIANEGEYYIEERKHSCSNPFNSFQVIYLEDSLFIPNVITDNDDLKNDKFEIYIDNVQSLSMTIFNRYGDLIFKQDDYQANWPDKEIPAGVYFYECKFSTMCNSKISEAKGWIQLLK